MNSRVFKSSAMKLAFALAILLLVLANQAQAKAPGTRSGTPVTAAVALISPAGHSGMKIKNEAELKARLLYLIARNPKAAKVFSEGCGCAALGQGAAVGFWGCLKNCMADMGISPYAMIMCGASCAAAETGIGAVVCAICIGASVTVIQTCALGCAMNGGKGFGAMMDASAVPSPRATSGVRHAKVRLQTTKGT